MSNRLESERKIDMSVSKKLKGMPTYVSEWNSVLKASRTTAATRRTYVSIIYNLLLSIDEDLINVKPDSINYANITNYYISIQTKNKNGKIVYTSDSYQQLVWYCLSSFCKFLKDRGYVSNNYIETISKPKNHDLDRVNSTRVLLTQNDFKKIYKTVKENGTEFQRTRNKAIFGILMTTGIRRSALCNIMIEDYNTLNNKLTVIDKGNKLHEYEISDVVAKDIESWLTYRKYVLKKYKDPHMFISYYGNQLNGDEIYELVTKYTKKAIGKAVSPHKLRSGYCSILYKKTGDIEFVRRAVGHANASTTQRYIVTKGEEKKKAAEIMGSIF